MRRLAFACAVIVASASSAFAQAPAPATPPAAPAPAAAPATPAPAAAADLDAGANSFKKCFACHSVGENAKNKVGPELNGLDGRKAGTAEGYSYSDANKNSGLTWDEATFSEYIKDPRAKIPNTKMVFAGIKSENEIKNLWAYLAQYDARARSRRNRRFDLGQARRHRTDVSRAGSPAIA